jgi:cell division protease FtsH
MSTEQKVEVNLEEINIKKRRLEVIKQELKSEFIGIDYIIDELINYIQIWYLMPDVLVRPIVVNLWGMTGVGKTDLIRRLVSKLEYQDRFVEVELSHGENYWYTSVASIFESNCINDGKPAIVLFDEIQRFYTIDPEGKVVTNTRSQDFWELLSDGRLSKKIIKSR